MVTAQERFLILNEREFRHVFGMAPRAKDPARAQVRLPSPGSDSEGQVEAHWVFKASDAKDFGALVWGWITLKPEDHLHSQQADRVYDTVSAKCWQDSDVRAVRFGQGSCWQNFVIRRAFFWWEGGFRI